MAQSKEEQVAKNRECRKRNGGKYNARAGSDITMIQSTGNTPWPGKVWRVLTGKDTTLT